MCRSRRELSNAYLLPKFGLDTAENEPCKVCPIERAAVYSRPTRTTPRRGPAARPRAGSSPGRPTARPSDAANSSFSSQDDELTNLWCQCKVMSFFRKMCGITNSNTPGNSLSDLPSSAAFRREHISAHHDESLRYLVIHRFLRISKKHQLIFYLF